MNRQIGVGDTKNVIVFHPLLTGHVIRRMRSGSVRIFNGNPMGNVIIHNSRTDRRRGFNLGGNYRRGVDACGILNGDVLLSNSAFFIFAVLVV